MSADMWVALAILTVTVSPLCLSVTAIGSSRSSTTEATGTTVQRPV